ncbi:InlB B-repeat-containing protein [Lysinibacillus capsici]|uniref:InlB B-repeat-containing protein n=1 Tax=Lysinibacillus capsici TaxID=2115968 RepID=UPI0029DE8875|nr:InlB B-repeat-containing protein [Lysinibacillus capsici]WPK05663.1 InlB B-repeat-containing protein [Lysinibacillus capsici]
MMKIFSRLKIGILCICMIVLNLSSMTIVEVPRVSATTFPSSEDFESSDGVGTNPRIIGDWEFALLKIDGTLDDSNNSNNDIDDFYPTDKSLGMSGYPGIVTTASIKSIKGNFKLNSLRLESAVNEIVELKIEGYRDNTFVTGAVVINQYMPFEKIDVPLTGEPWQNIDEIRISRTDGVADIFVRIYHLDVSASVTSTEDLIPPEISNPSINVMNISNNSVTLNWLKATDNITSTEDLEYQIYQSTSNNIDTVSHIETNGIALGNYSKDIATFDIPDLLQNTTYYFNIIVKDAAGNKTAYTMVNVTTLKAYSVSFSVDGGSTVPAQTIAHGEKATEPPSPTKAGHTFVGWYTSSMGNTPFNFDTAITGATTIYAKWNPVTHTVSFDVDGGSTIPAQTIAHGEKATEPPSPTKVGHTFVGWYTSSTGNTPFNFDTAITGDTIVYAKWNPLTYTVSFDVDGGNTIPAQTIAHGEKTTEPPSPTKAGHTFVGWYTSSMGNTPFNFDTTITGDITIYAKWSPVTHTVSFDVDGGSTIPAQTIAHGEKATEPPSPTKVGHTFVGWYTSSTGNTPFNFDTAITGDTIVYAKWNPLTYTVSFDVDGGNTIPAQTIAHGEKATEPPPPTKVGHTFVGWYTSSTGNTPFNFDTVITGDTTIYAKWNPVTHTVSFDVDGGSTVPAQTIAHGEKATEPPPPTKAGHTFVGWYTSSTGNTPFNFDTVITGDTTIYAKWNPVTHTVSFDVDGGSIVPAQTIAHGEKATEPPSPTKAGHTFVGWYTSSSGNTAFNFDTAITGATMIYAKWNPVTHTVSFDVDGGSTVPAQTIAHGEKATEPPPPTKVGHTFIGWYTSSTGNTPFNFDTVITGDTTIYAKWNPVTHTVSFDVDGGSTIPAQTIAHGEKATEPPPPTKAGHTFVGWYTSSMGNTAFNFDTTITGDTMIYAKWNPVTVTHTVSFDVAGGSAVSNQVVVHEGKAGQPTPAPTKAGYTFGGWYTSNAYTTPYNFNTLITANTVIYAKWISNNTGGGNTDPSPNPDSGSSTPSTNVEEIVVDVESGNGDVVSKTTIKRAKNVDNTMNDDVTLTAASATETIRKLKEQGNDKARIIIPDEKDQVNQVQVSIPKHVLSLLQNGAVHLEIVTDNVRIEVPKTSLEMFSENLYFRLVPIKGHDKQLEIVEQAKRETVVQQLVEGAVVKLLGRPMTIETNMQSRPVKLTLPLPTDLTDEQLANLAIFIEHSDGTKEVVRGKVVEYQKGIGLQFEVNKFSTFSILYLPEKEEVKEPITEGVTHLPYIQGYPDDTFRPNAPVTRAQMASMFARQLTGNAIPQAKATYTDTFQHDAKDAIEFAKEKGLFKGVTATNFNPNGFITRAQMATVAAHWIEQQCVERPDADFCSPTSQSAVFKDVSVHHWARQAIDTVNAAEIMTGITADTFNPDGLLTRAQAVKVLNRLFERQILIEDQTPLFKDVPKHHWAFYEIQEAAKK